MCLRSESGRPKETFFFSVLASRNRAKQELFSLKQIKL